MNKQFKKYIKPNKKLMELLIQKSIKIINKKNEFVYSFDDRLRQTILNITGNNQKLLKDILYYLDSQCFSIITFWTYKNLDIRFLKEGNYTTSDAHYSIYYSEKFNIYQTVFPYNTYRFGQLFFNDKKEAYYNGSYYIKKLNIWLTEDYLKKSKNYLTVSRNIKFKTPSSLK